MSYSRKGQLASLRSIVSQSEYERINSTLLMHRAELAALDAQIQTQEEEVVDAEHHVAYIETLAKER
ncbi:hypothetical protein [Pajaroellobacter abortibovis]|uniref:Uncharacterized protein n=1 Tax=Pajaroellobacter abortibovis TaxID=1882918 RepID=A0A1L6MWU6_9BACT|nr:hypothetical protein [Pajaroellobacter abortibovis]APR99887.1 hypothetical protein BCY86_03740 [Pajaroellobacter abortibovis]